jgi:fungal STAND N-terminal Goodbye domain
MFTANCDTVQHSTGSYDDDIRFWGLMITCWLFWSDLNPGANQLSKQLSQSSPNWRDPLSTFMSSTHISSANFQSILNAALDSYARRTGIDLMKHPSIDKLQSCHGLEDVLELLQDREAAFEDYRNKHRKLINCLRPVVQVIHAFSGVLGEVGGVSGSTLPASDFILMPIHQVSFQPTKAIFVGIDVLLAVSIFCTFLIEVIVKVSRYVRPPMT